MATRIRVLLNHLQPTAATCPSILSASPASAGSGKASAPLIAAAEPSAGYQYVAVETRGRVGIITLCRPKQLNAISLGLVGDLNRAIAHFEAMGTAIGCLILTGSGRAFAAGADIKEMIGQTFAQKNFSDPTIEGLCRLETVRLPVIAAVNGFAFGGGCELAMMCDIIWASENAKFGQPEISIGTIPGAGGTQRLTRAVGKSKAMEMCLSGQPIDAKEALQFGLVSRVLPADQLLDAALLLADNIAAKSRPVALAAKDAVNKAFETTLQTGVEYERRVFHSTFALKDRREGMEAFAAKRKPNFVHE